MDSIFLRKYAQCSVIVDHFKTAIWKDGSFFILRPSHCDYHCDDCFFQIDCEAIIEGPRLCEILFGKQIDGFSVGAL